MQELIQKLEQKHFLMQDEYIRLLTDIKEADREYLFSRARSISQGQFGNKVYTRGLIEFSNFCRNDCYYCGIRRSNNRADRYRLTRDEILECCREGYELGFRTFVLQGGEDGGISDREMVEMIGAIKGEFPLCALTLSIGEKERAIYQAFFAAGADRYLLRHETASSEHYDRLHPSNLSLSKRKQCLFWLKEIGFQTGTGFMVGSPYQTVEYLAADLQFIYELNPQMIGIGPFIPHKDTPFHGNPAGTLEQTLVLVGMLRLMFPKALIPSTTALGTIHPDGREMGILAGANVVMPNLSPIRVRKKYLLYDDKICTGEEAAESVGRLQRRMESIGYQLVSERGDYPI